MGYSIRVAIFELHVCTIVHMELNADVNRTVTCRYGVDRTRANRPLTFQSHARSKVTSLNRQIKIHMWHVTRYTTYQVPTDSCNSLTTVVCNGRFTTIQSLRDNMWSRRLCRVVKRKSCETILDTTGATYDDACVTCRLRSQHRGHSPVDIDSHKLSSWKVVNVRQCEQVNTHR